MFNRLTPLIRVPPRILHSGCQKCFSSASTPASASPPLTPLDSFKAKLPVITAAAGAVVVSYGVWKILWFVTGEFMSLNFTTVAAIGFSCGLATAGLLSASVVYGRRFLYLRPRVVSTAALSLLKPHPKVAELVGKNVSFTSTLTYINRHGHLGVNAAKRPTWIQPQSQVAFQVSGEKGSALVCAEGELQGGRVELTMLTIDSPSFSGPVVIKDASEQKLQARQKLLDAVKSLSSSLPL